MHHYGGVKYTKVRHAIQCRLCKQTLEAPFKMCSCNTVGIGDRILGTAYDRSVYAAKINGKTIWLPHKNEATKL